MPDITDPVEESYWPDGNVAREALDHSLRDVQLGSYDRQILRWLKGWDPPTIWPIASMLERARLAGREESRATAAALEAERAAERSWLEAMAVDEETCAESFRAKGWDTRGPVERGGAFAEVLDWLDEYPHTDVPDGES